jgi:hypothetical protein
MIDNKKLAVCKNEMEKTMISFLEAKGYQVFVGGSRRFGYSDERSDIDLMVLSKVGKFRLNMALVSMGFSRAADLMAMQYEEESEVWHLGKLIHICIFKNERQFNELKEEHVRIEKILKKNILMRDFIKGLKSTGTISGAIIYRILRNACGAGKCQTS